MLKGCLMLVALEKKKKCVQGDGRRCKHQRTGVWGQGCSVLSAIGVHGIVLLKQTLIFETLFTIYKEYF